MNCFRDIFYTPEILADKLASLIIEDSITSVIDFCVGEGNLLKAIKKKIPEVKCFGTDISEKSISLLQKTHKDWKLDICDFTNMDSIKSLKGLGDRKYDLIVLNPPFTCKGSSIYKTTFDGVEYTTSTAMLFVTNALNFLAKNGVLYAILPSSCAYSNKDFKLWKYLREYYNLQILENPEHRYWHNCSANIIIVSIGGVEKREIDSNQNFDFNSLPIENISRGHLSPHEVKYVKNNDGIIFIHTTHLKNNAVISSNRIYIPKKRNGEPRTCEIYSGPAVLIPRVGNPNKSKICIYKKKDFFIPSDCVIVLSTKSIKKAVYVTNYLCDHWIQFKNIYQGTAAKYTTMERVFKLFGKLK